MNIEDMLNSGLQALADNAFPKKCANCNRTYNSAEEYLRETESLNNKTSIKAIEDEEESFLELYRNCVCGSTLMDFFENRRDTTDKGLKRREAFGKVLSFLIAKGLNKKKAREELIKLIRGEKTTYFKDNNISLTLKKKALNGESND